MSITVPHRGPLRYVQNCNILMTLSVLLRLCTDLVMVGGVLIILTWVRTRLMTQLLWNLLRLRLFVVDGLMLKLYVTRVHYWVLRKIARLVRTLSPVLVCVWSRLCTRRVSDWIVKCTEYALVLFVPVSLNRIPRFLNGIIVVRYSSVKREHPS